MNPPKGGRMKKVAVCFSQQMLKVWFNTNDYESLLNQKMLFFEVFQGIFANKQSD